MKDESAVVMIYLFGWPAMRPNGHLSGDIWMKGHQSRLISMVDI
jgi:hypothetical protein